MSENTQLDTLMETVEEIRAKKYPNIPSELVRQLLLRHGNTSASQVDLMRDLEALVTKFSDKEA